MSLQENRGHELNAVVSSFLGLTWVSVLMRCYVRIFLTKDFRLDDCFLLVAIIIFTITAAFVVVGVHYGLGAHDKALSRDNEVQALKYQALVIILYIANVAFVKLSIAFLLLRIAVQRRYIWILKISWIVVAVWTTGIFLYNLFQCTPVAYQWDTRIAGGKCVSPDSVVHGAYSFSVLSVLSDWLFALIPIPMLWNVQLDRQTKIFIAGILSLGIVASIAPLIRIKYLIEISDTADILFSSTDALKWSVIETGLGTTAASLVTLRPLLRAMHIKGFNSSGDSSGMPDIINLNSYRPSAEFADTPLKIPSKEMSRAIEPGRETVRRENASIDDISVIQGQGVSNGR